MKRSLLNMLALMVSCLGFYSCKDDRLGFEEAPAVYFNKAVINPDSLNYTFAVKAATVTTDTVYLSMKIMGNAVGKDRVIGITVKSNSTAKNGYHFRLGEPVMPAGKFESKVPIYIYRRPGLKDSVLNANFVIEASADFQPGYSDVPFKTPRTEYKISITDQLLKPSNWDTSLSPYFGTFSIVKFRFMIETTGKLIWTGPIYDGERNSLISQLRIALYNYEQKNGPMIDENGSVVVLP